jgi:type I restriction enzyme S subunit
MKTVKLGVICESINGLWTGKKGPFETAKVVRNTNFTKDCRLDLSSIAILEVESRQLATRRLYKGDLIIEKSGGGPKQPVGRVVLFEEEDHDFSFSNFTSVLRIRQGSGYIPKYLYYFIVLQYITGVTETMQSNTTGIRNLNFKQYLDMDVPNPSLPEQKAIVEKLDAAFAEIDKLEANLETKSRYTNELLNSILGSTFSGDNADPNPHQGPAVKMVELGDIASIQTGKIDVNKAVPGGKYPFFTCSKDTYKIDEAPFEGKVILVAGNGDLNVKYYEGKFNAYQRTYFLFVNNEEIVFPKYLYYFLESYVGQLRAESIGSTIKYIKMGNLTDAEMPLPSLPEQKAIVEKLDTAFAEIDKLREWTKQAKQSFSALRQSILSSVFTEKSDAA